MVINKKSLLSFFLVLMVGIIGGIFINYAVGVSSVNVGIVDINRLVTESPKIIALQMQAQQKSKEISERYEKEKVAIKGEELQRKQQSANSELRKIHMDYNGAIKSMVDQALADVAREQRFSHILTKDTVLKGGTDVTIELIKRLQ